MKLAHPSADIRLSVFSPLENRLNHCAEKPYCRLPPIRLLLRPCARSENRERAPNSRDRASTAKRANSHAHAPSEHTSPEATHPKQASSKEVKIWKKSNAKTELATTNQHSTERHESTQTNKDTHNSGKKSNYQNCSEVTADERNYYSETRILQRENYLY
jgi:hypothetical protein